MSGSNPFPALDAATEAALTESIRRFGVLVPVVNDQRGRLIDGHHRSRIADALGVDYRVDAVSVSSEAQSLELASTLNTDRRQLTVAQRREVTAALREQGHSLRAIATAVGVDDKTVRNDLSTADYSAVPGRVTGLDGKSRPSSRPSIVASKNAREAARAQEALRTAPVPTGKVIDVRRAERLACEASSNARRREPVAAPDVSGDIEILHGDFREVLSSRDLAGAKIVTDLLDRPGVVGAAPARPCVSRVRLPPASPHCCDSPEVGIYTPHGSTAPHGARRGPRSRGCAGARPGPRSAPLPLGGMRLAR